MGRTLEGSRCHQEMMQQSRQILEKQGYEVVFSAHLEGGGIVDVLGIKNGEKVAIECQVVPNWKTLVQKIKRYTPYLSKLIVAIPESVTPRLAPEGIEILKLPVKRYTRRVMVVLDDDVEDMLRRRAMRKGDISKICVAAVRRWLEETKQ